MVTAIPVPIKVHQQKQAKGKTMKKKDRKKHARRAARMEAAAREMHEKITAGMERLMKQKPAPPVFISLVSGESFFGHPIEDTDQIVAMPVNNLQVTDTLFGNFLMAQDEQTLVTTIVGDRASVSFRPLSPAQLVDWERIESLYHMAAKTARSWATRQRFAELLNPLGK